MSKREWISRFENLNENQKRAVETIDGPVLVIAGPGTGKTELLAVRTANILKNTQVSAANILLLTFTESGSFNMRERVVSMIGEEGYRVAIYTFHSFARDIMSRYPEYFFDGANYRVANDLEKLNIIENILEKMPKKSQISKKHFELGYTYTNDILSCIGALKKGNLSPEDFKTKILSYTKEWAKINKTVSILEQSSGKRNFEIVRDTFVLFLQELKNIQEKNPDYEYTKYLINTLEMQINISVNLGEHKNLNEWRDDFFKTVDKQKILKDSREEKIQKWLELADVYQEYSEQMHKNGLYDFDDMIFLVGKQLEFNENLRSELSEKYQYVMVDEFQDTNESQFSLIQNLTKNTANGDSPNILVVGDDDQAIYKFQGAELSNIFKFLDNYSGITKVVLDKNYRSTQEVLDFSRNIITKAIDRLENRDSKITKKLFSSNQKYSNSKVGEIVNKNFSNDIEEFEFIANEIKSLITSGISPNEISVISKKHENLKILSNYLNQSRIPYSYEKKEHVLDKPHIHELITIVDFVNSGLRSQIKEELLPEILSYKFWQIENIEIWKIAENVRELEYTTDEFGQKNYKKKSWLSEILNSENDKVKKIGEFLIELIKDAKNLPLEQLLDKIIGTTEWEFEGEYADLEKTDNNLSVSGNISPYKNYYFGAENFKHNKTEYLEFLFALRTFIGALREFKHGQILKSIDLEEFVEIYKNNDRITLTMNNPFASGENSVILQTAYKAKGLEYEYVFVLNVTEREWNGRGMANKIGFPEPLKLLPEQDSIDDKIRLFYVALTRAKHTLYLTHCDQKLSFTLDENDSATDNKISKKEKKETINDNTIKVLNINTKKEFVTEEKILLSRLLENYQMPVTHLTNFLNLDKVGPEKFIEQNLLRFPQAMSADSIYGSAMHKAIQDYYIFFKNTKKLGSKEKLNSLFKNALILYKMPEEIFDKHFDSGISALDKYFENLKEMGGIDERDIIECNFKNEGVHFQSVNATGKIDKISETKEGVWVTDFKTGKSFSSWEPKDSEYTKIKLHFYSYQLVYYYLLLKNSRSYCNKKILGGKIEFLEPDDNDKINTLKLEFSSEIIERVERLANIVYNKIMNLDFPDTSKYSLKEDGTKKDEIKLTDILNFEEDLLNGLI